MNKSKKDNNFIGYVGNAYSFFAPKTVCIYPHVYSFFRDDAEALKSDWNSVGQDLWGAMKTFREKYKINLDETSQSESE